MTDDYAEIDRINREKWNGAHQAQHEGALSGSNPTGVLCHHGICHEIHRGRVILDIGVGLGYMARLLSAAGCTVDCLDIADAAEATVRGYARKFYRADRIGQLPTNEYDIAISMIVAQHMCERNLLEQIRYVFRALKPGGFYSLHLAGATEGPLNNLSGEIPPGMDGAMCRTPEYALAMIDGALGGRPDYRAELQDYRVEWPQFKSYWYFLRVHKERS